MRPSPLTILLSASVVALAGCAHGVAEMERGAAAPIAPPDGSDRPGASPTQRAEVAGLPDWLRIRLADYDAQTGAAAPRVVYEVRYGDGVAYFTKAGCCDQLDPLVDARGVLVCYPSGGITGRGDGKCPGALPPVAGWREVWRHR